MPTTRLVSPWGKHRYTRRGALGMHQHEAQAQEHHADAGVDEYHQVAGTGLEQAARNPRRQRVFDEHQVAHRAARLRQAGWSASS